MSRSPILALAAAVSAFALAACASEPPAAAAGDGAAPAAEAGFLIPGTEGASLRAVALETFDSPWAMTFLPDGRALVTEKGGALWLLGPDGRKAGQVTGIPSVEARGQGGLGDIILHPDFATTGEVYLSYAERDGDNDELSGAAVEIATLTLTPSGGALSARRVIWRQFESVPGNGHYGHRLAVSPDRYLFISSGERQKFTPAQDMGSTLGKVVRLNLDGSVPADNPFAAQGGPAAEVWTLGHRNPLGLAFAADGKLWLHEMGPRHGDELNLILPGQNYGYPEVSNGDHYDGREIPDHDTRPEFAAPAAYWVPAISPAGLDIYEGDLFPGWSGNALIGGLSSEALVRVAIAEDGTAAEAARYEWGKRVREVEVGPDGAVYVLEDKDGARLLRLTPAG
ncbi:PQQ-dependent sugar dehydrogenase [Hyphomonas sp.]|uniref:PQQ-dependent sugar dehydrogenase n=1 Tax=Hyphomonas sp. TaxID=87 RepID=UPI00391DA748